MWCLQIPVPSQRYVPISIVLCEIDIHRASLVVRRASRTVRILTLEVMLEAWTVQDSHMLMYLPQPQVIFTSQFSFFIFVFFSADPGDGYIPRRRALDAEHCKYHENSLCACLNGMYPTQGFTFAFQMFFPKDKWLRAFWKSVELSSSAKLSQPVRTQLLRIFHPSRVASAGFFI